jgi:ribonuclease BN (tRNA processing enzyme)
MAYVPDHALGTATPGERERALDLVRGVDILIHDAQFVDGEQRIADAYGHSTVEHLLEFASTAGVKKLVLFHHSPIRTDDQVETIGVTAASKAEMPVVVAREGTSLDI